MQIWVRDNKKICLFLSTCANILFFQRSSSHQHGGEQTIPLDITIQTIFGFVLAMVSVLQIAGDFKEIRAGIEMGKKTWENARNRPSFYVYNHRGKVFSPHYEPPVLHQPMSNARRPLQDIPSRFLS